MPYNVPYFNIRTPLILQQSCHLLSVYFGRPIKDFISILPGRYIPHPTWSDTLAAREEARSNRHMKEAEWLTTCTPGDYHHLQSATTYVFKTRQVYIPTSGTRQASSLLTYMYLLNPLHVSKHIRPRSKCAIGFWQVLIVPSDPMSSCFP